MFQMLWDATNQPGGQYAKEYIGCKEQENTLLPASRWAPSDTGKNKLSHNWILNINQQLVATEEQVGACATSSRYPVKIKLTRLTQTHGWSMLSFSGPLAISVTAL